MKAERKDNGQPLSDLHICAQAFTFVLAGQYHPSPTTSTLPPCAAACPWQLAHNKGVACLYAGYVC